LKSWEVVDSRRSPERIVEDLVLGSNER
jgi:hypothetical protein